MPERESLAQILPECRLGAAEIIHSSSKNRCILLLDGVPFMNDGPEERADLDAYREHASGRVLVFGLGLGLVLAASLDRPVTRIVVVEKSKDVIALVGSIWREVWKLRKPECELTIIEGDAFTYDPGPGAFDAIWIDIWPTDAPSYRAEAALLRARYRGCLGPGGWLGVWREVARCGSPGPWGPCDDERGHPGLHWVTRRLTITEDPADQSFALPEAPAATVI